MTTGEPKVRLDKWLWAARCFKTRSMASKACDGGHAQVNGEVAKSSRKVGVGDLVDVRTAGGRRVLEVRGLAEKRGPAKVAVTLYDDQTPPEPVSTMPRHLRRIFEEGPGRRDPGTGRPTKRDRRKMTKVRGHKG